MPSLLLRNATILTMDDAIQAMMANNTYLNIHTSANPSGEIRGQLIVR